MKVGLRGLFFGMSWIISAGADPALEYNFNQFSDGPIEGQFEWNIFEKVKDSSSLSIMNDLGTSGEPGDKALVVGASAESIHCVTGEPARWLPGKTMTTQFDFKVAVDPVDVANNRPVMTLMVGNSLLSEKVSWTVVLEATPGGDWRLSGSMPDAASKKIYSENFLIRSDEVVSISEWHQMVLVIKKLSEPDSFESAVKLINPVSGEVIAELVFTDINKDKVTKSMWNTTRAHVGFSGAKDQLGLAIIDNLKISVAAE